MSTPLDPERPNGREGRHSGPDAAAGPEETPVWGRPPAGGWGGPGGRDGAHPDPVAERTGAWSPDEPDWEIDDDWQPGRRGAGTPVHRAAPDPAYDPAYGPAYDQRYPGVHPPPYPPEHEPAYDRYGAAVDPPEAGRARYAAEPGRVYPARPRRRRSPLPLVVAGAAALVLALVGVLGFVTPGFFVTRVLDPAAVQEGVQEVLTDDYGVEGVADVTCPADVQVAAGAAFECRATVDGDGVRVPVHITSDDAEYQVGRPL